MPLRLTFPSAPEGSRAAADTVVTGMTEVGTAAPGLEMPPCRGIPNLGGKPARFAAVCPTKIRYTFLSHSGGKDHQAKWHWAGSEPLALRPVEEFQGDVVWIAEIDH